VHPALAHLETGTVETSAHTLTLARILRYLYVFSDNDLIHCGEATAELSPQVRNALLAQAIRRQNHILHLHAGVVGKDGRLILLPGKSGSGKTLLTARLVASGCEYYSDEVALVERDTDRVRPVPLSLCVKESGIGPLAPHFPGLLDLPAHRRKDGAAVRYLPPPPPRSLPEEGRSGIPAVLVFPVHVDGAPAVLRPLSAAEAFGRLLDECVAIPRALSVADATALVGIVAGMRCFTLTSGDPDSAAEAILEIVR
jgi:hypothetical protein